MALTSTEIVKRLWHAARVLWTNIILLHSMFCMISYRFCGIVLMLSVVTLFTSEETVWWIKYILLGWLDFTKQGCVWGVGVKVARRMTCCLSTSKWRLKMVWFFFGIVEVFTKKQWRSQGLPGWATCPPGELKWGRKFEKFQGKIWKNY